jgi:RecB family exonuclease
MPAWGLVVRVAAPIEQLRRSLASASRYEGAIPGVNMSRLTAPETVWSASRLESYRMCPFQFFAHYGLGLRELDEELEEADARVRGIVMHDMLDDAIAPLVEHALPLDDAGLAVALERLHARGRGIWDEAPMKYAFGRVALWQYDGESVIRELELMLAREAALAADLGMLRVIGGERVFSHALPFIEPPLVVEARVDRVDESDDAIQIVDYKTGRSIPRSDVDSGHRLQLQLYATVAGAALGAEHLIARYAFLRTDRKDWWLDSERPDDAEVLANAAAGVRDSVTAGMFEVSPQEPTCPSYCSFRTMCRVNPFSRSKTWR